MLLFRLNRSPSSDQLPFFICQVRAVDPDEGANGEVWYKIIGGNNNNSFALNPETGILYPAVSLLDRAQPYKLKIEARDVAGKGPYSDTCNIYVRVITVNQHKPEFIMPELPNATVRVPEVRFNTIYVLCMSICLIESQGSEITAKSIT